MRQILLLAFTMCVSQAGAATYADAPFLGSTLNLPRISFCKVNKCVLLSTTPLPGHVEEMYRVNVPGDSGTYYLNVLRRGGKAIRVGDRAFGQDYFASKAHVELLLFATGTQQKLNADGVQTMLDSNTLTVLRGYAGRKYWVQLANWPGFGLSDILFAITEELQY
ncbi:hypothetical protein [Deinococcus peraridilitoris]|uniref:Uncharacterized protein n=1 Tax=Deinococcus peraridilitoris (strain DSM 19664 / LMG 22246 / CIP 109416 / KR-200) TaxID=937777 RepID=L0A235_DEIPD|nr:hypothetical protein [Deinococcus peraridilitoris]AFZ67065.1 hypothetical protein Deipe_1524 [Deinococcus peraridilitoris DSM 19664]